MDRRQQKTRQAIFNAFSSLLEKKNFNNITVQEIIDEANVGRSTFYAHFETKDSLLKAMCTDIFQHVFSDDLKQESSHDFSHSGHDLQKEITHILYHLQDNIKNLKGLLSCESGDIFMAYFKEYLEQTFPLFIKEMPYDVPYDYLLNHVVCSFSETVRWWITKQEQYTPEQIAAFFVQCVLK
ncbi:MAG: TetR/AcrR family transcriptional regulator [Lachnospiraceae bacterium]|nr:TetR/AcrR family transcriptional regulator [Lachnospiraceae bacterium]